MFVYFLLRSARCGCGHRLADCKCVQMNAWGLGVHELCEGGLSVCVLFGVHPSLDDSCVVELLPSLTGCEDGFWCVVSWYDLTHLLFSSLQPLRCMSEP